MVRGSSLNIVVLGLGSIGLRYVGLLVELGHRVIGYDPDPERGSLLKPFGGILGTDREAVCRSADAMVICTPNAQHISDLALAVNLGKPVFVEKPLAHVLDPTERLIDLAIVKKLLIFPGLNLRFHPVISYVKSLMHEHRFGEVLWARFHCASYLPSWRPNQDHRKGYACDPISGGVIFDCIHELDLANYLLGKMSVLAAFACASQRLDIAADDCADMILSHGPSLRSMIHLDYLSRPRRRSIEIMTTEGLLYADIIGRSVKFVDINDNMVTEQTFGGSVQDDYRAQMCSFVACLEGKEVPRCGAGEALEVLRQTLFARQLAGLPQAGLVRKGATV